MMAYYWARMAKGWQSQDGGSFIFDCFEQIQGRGLCLESYHPFRDASGNYTTYTAPDESAVRQASRHKALGARRLDRTQIDDALASGHPVVFGFTVYQHRVFAPDVVQSGQILKPAHYNDFGGGHAMCIAGYDMTSGKVWGPNSWGTTWGSSNHRKAGWFEMDMDYLHDPKLSSDFWMLDGVEEVAA